MSDAEGLIDLARRIATEAHQGQVDKAGVAYISHPARVAARLVGDDAAEIVAWLHDVVEDTETTLHHLARDFPPFIITAVEAMSRRGGEPPDDYYARVRANPIARAVKLADIADNSDPQRRAALDPATQERLNAKYEHALRRLGARLENGWRSIGTRRASGYPASRGHGHQRSSHVMAGRNCRCSDVWSRAK